MFSFKSILYLLFIAQFRVPPITIWLKQQQFALIINLLSHFRRNILIRRSLNHNYSLHTRNVSSHKTDWILSELPLCIAFYIAEQAIWWMHFKQNVFGLYELIGKQSIMILMQEKFLWRIILRFDNVNWAPRSYD